MIPDFFTMAAAVSCLLCLAACAFSVRSYWVMNYLAVTSQNLHRLGISRGRLELDTYRRFSAHVGLATNASSTDNTRVLGPAPYSDKVKWSLGWQIPERWPTRTSSYWGLERNGGALKLVYSGLIEQSELHSVNVLWLIGFLAGLPIVRLGSGLIEANRRHRRERNQLCVSCGYDISMTCGCCPECGGVIGEIKQSKPK